MKTADVIFVITHFGFSKLLRFLFYKAKLKTGYFRKLNFQSQWSDFKYNGEIRSYFKRYPQIQASAVLVNEANRILAGDISYFSGSYFIFPGWSCSPISNVKVEIKHWTYYRDFDAARGDIKWYYEPSRFDWLYVLGRAYIATDDLKYAIYASNMLKDWVVANPPNHSIAWRCAQECSLRAMALMWSFEIFKKSGDIQAQNLIIQIVEASAYRIEGSLDYSAAQNNNHALSENLALYAAGVFLQNHRRSEEWICRGRKNFLRELDSQFSADFYSMSSFYYNRVALRWVCLFAHIEGLFGRAFPENLATKVLSCGSILIQSMDLETGRVPNYGANDGSNPHRLSDASYDDFRPVLALLFSLLGRVRVFSGDANSEDEIAWHEAQESIQNKSTVIIQKSSKSNDGGYYVLRNRRTFVGIRCHSFAERPSQADLLHADVWIEGRNVALDSGSYSYCDTTGLGLSLSGSFAHNGPILNDLEQMRRAGAFLWTQWPSSKIRFFGTMRFEKDEYEVWSGYHTGYDATGGRPVRTILLKGSSVLVIDQVERLQDDKVLCRRINWKLPATYRASAVENHLIGTIDDNISFEVLSLGDLKVQDCTEDHHSTFVSPTYGFLSKISPVSILTSSIHPIYTCFNGSISLVNDKIIIFNDRRIDIEFIEQRIRERK